MRRPEWMLSIDCGGLLMNSQSWELRPQFHSTKELSTIRTSRLAITRFTGWSSSSSDNAIDAQAVALSRGLYQVFASVCVNCRSEPQVGAVYRASRNL